MKDILMLATSDGMLSNGTVQPGGRNQGGWVSREDRGQPARPWVLVIQDNSGTAVR